MCRLLMVALMSPVLVNIGYKINWRGMLMVAWSGLRGAVGLALALVVEQTDTIYSTNIGSKVGKGWFLVRGEVFGEVGVLTSCSVELKFPCILVGPCQKSS